MVIWLLTPAFGHQHVSEKTLADGDEREGNICFKFQDPGEHESNELNEQAKGRCLRIGLLSSIDPYG